MRRTRTNAKPKAVQTANRLAADIGATIEVGCDEITAQLPAGKVWEMSGTRELIASRESGETMIDVWADLAHQMELGVILGVVRP